MRAAVVSSIAILLGGAAQADPAELGLGPLEGIDLPFDHGELALTARGTAPDAGSDRYQDGSLALAGAIPLLGHGPTGWRLLAQFRAEGELVQTAALPRVETISKDALGATVLYVSQRRDLYALYAGAGIGESTATISSPTLMPTAIGLGTYRSGALTWIYGGGFGYALGRSWLLPAAGVSWRASPTWTLSTLLPVDAEVRHALSASFALSLLVSVSGDLYRVANDGAFPGASDTLTVGLAQLRTGLRAQYKLGDRWALRAEVGVVGPRRLQITDGSETEWSSTSTGTFYLSTGVSYAFDHAPL